MKASEHFDLPLEAHQESLYQQDGADEYFYELSVAEFNTPEQAKVAANCINHADALADALAELLECAAENNLEGLQTYDDAYAALEAYRGVK